VREDIEPIFSKDFVQVRIAEEMQGFDELMDLLGGKGAGFPWLVVLREDGSPIIDSTDPQRNRNIGSPIAEWEIEHWNAMMRAAALRITEEEIQYMATTLAEDRQGD
jgi:hypothetical protein